MGGGQLPNRYECNSMLMKETSGVTLTPYPSKCNSTLTSGPKHIYPYPYIDVDERGHQ